MCKNNLFFVKDFICHIFLNNITICFGVFSLKAKPFFNTLNCYNNFSGKTELSEEKQVWKVSPLLCFQNDLSIESALKVCF